MSPRGGWRGGGRKKLETKGLRARVSLSCRVEPDLLEWLEAQETTLSLGERVDAAIRTLQKYPEELEQPKTED